MQYLDAISKTTEWSLFPRQTIQYTLIQVYALTNNAEEAEVEQFYEDLQDLLELTPKKDVLFIIGDWNAKVGSQEIPGVTGKFGLGVQNEARAKASRVFPRECTGHSKHPVPTTQKKTLHMDITPHGQHWYQIDYILCSKRWRSSTPLAKKKRLTCFLGDCGSNHEFLIAKFRLNWRKEGIDHSGMT